MTNTGITKDALGDFLGSVRDSFEPQAYRAHLRACARSAPLPPGVIEPTIEDPRMELRHAKAILERHGYTVVPTDRIATVEVSHRFDWRELEAYKDLDAIIATVRGGLAGQLGVKIVDAYATREVDVTGTMGRCISLQATIIMPEKA